MNAVTDDVIDDRLEDEPAGDVDDNTPPVDDSSDEEKERASRMGWADEDRFRGDPNKWVPAKEFLRRGEELMPILRERLHKQDDEIKDLRSELRGVVRQHERQVREEMESKFEQRKREAVESADTDAYDEVSKEERAWREKQAPAATEEPQQLNDVFEGWRSENERFDKDPDIAATLDGMVVAITTRDPKLRGTREALDQATDRVKRAYPEKFENPNRRRPGGVEGARGPAAARGGKKTYADLPAAAKAKCNEYLEKNWVSSKEEYVTEYFNEE